MKKITSALFCTALLLSVACPAQAAPQVSVAETAALYLREQGIMVGDQNGEISLNSGLTRAQLAVVLTRLSRNPEHVLAEEEFYISQCKFPDVPDWARLYVGYCYFNGLMVGYDTGAFGTDDGVTPAAACTVILRYMDLPDVEWEYSTACQTALDQGLTTGEAIGKGEITRGDLAVMLYRAMVMAGETSTDSDTGSAANHAGDGYLTNGMPVTEENVLALLRQLEQDWPTGTIWGTHNTPGTHKNEVPCAVARKIMHEYPVSEYYGCGGYAAMISSLTFGDTANPARRVEDLSQIRPGDIIFRVRNDNGKVWHVLVALETPNEIHAFHVTDGNNGEAVDWPDPQSPCPYNNLDGYGEDKTYRLEAWTRYPENVPFTGESTNVWLSGIS